MLTAVLDALPAEPQFILPFHHIKNIVTYRTLTIPGTEGTENVDRTYQSSPRSRSHSMTSPNSPAAHRTSGWDSPSYTCDAADDPSGGLILSAARGDVDAVEGYLSNGVPVDSVTITTRESSLHLVCCHDDGVTDRLHTGVILILFGY